MAGLSARWSSRPSCCDRAKEIAREMTEETSAVSVALTRQMLWRFAGAPAPFELLDIDKPMSIERGGHADVREGVAGLSREAAAVISRKSIAGHAKPVSLVAGQETLETIPPHRTQTQERKPSDARPVLQHPAIRKPAVTSKGGIVAAQSRQGGASRRRGAGGRRRLRRCRDRDHLCARRAGALDERRSAAAARWCSTAPAKTVMR